MHQKLITRPRLINNMPAIQVLGTILCWVSLGAALDATSADNLATSIISQLGRTKGFVSIPHCGNGQLALSFLQKSSMKVHAMDSDAANVSAAGQLGEAAGFVAPRFYADKGTLALMPYQDRFVDCIVVTNLNDADLANVSYAEIQRTLSPGGMAWIGRATAEGAGITQAALQNWISAAAKTRSTASVSTVNGTWAVVTGKELSGVDVWARHNYDATGVRYSKDSVCAYPWLPQAKFKPYKVDNGCAVTSGGRIYMLFPDYSIGFDYQSPHPNQLRVYSIYNGELLWSRDVGGDGIGNMGGDPMTASPGYAYLKQANALLQLDGATGVVVRTQNFGLGSLSWWSAGQGTGLVYGSDGSTLVACSEATGAVAWSKTGGGVNMSENRILCGGVVYDAATGQPDNKGPLVIPPMPTKGLSACGPYTASITGTYGNSNVAGWDFTTNRQRAGHFYKPPCHVTGQVVSNGFLINAAPRCNCGSSRYRGTSIDAAAGSFQFDRDGAADGSDRIEKGPAFGAVSAQIVPDSLDWPTHRSTVIRNGRSLARLPNTLPQIKLLWNYQPAVNYVTYRTEMPYDYRPDQEPTPPVVVKGYTFFGGSDGCVRCIDNSTGRLKWSYRTGSRIYATPTVSDGCVYVGSGDGYAYCIEAHSGRLVWRFRGAPVDRRFNLYDYLTSMWPVLTGVTIYNGNAFFAAGVECEYGTHLYCVNARTGALVWQNNKSATWMNPVDRLGYTPVGYMTIARNRLLAANSVGSGASFDLATGVQDPMAPWLLNDAGVRNGYPPDGMSRDREIGILGNAYVVSSGAPIFRDNNFRRPTGFFEMNVLFNKLDANGMALYPKIGFNNAINTIPAWDDRDFFSGWYWATRLEKYSIADLTAKVDAQVVATGTASRNGVNQNYTNLSELNTTPAWFPATQAGWGTRKDISPNAIALAPNGLVLTYAKQAIVSIPESVDWYVGVLDRTTGATSWETKVPDEGRGLKGEPEWGGLAIDRNGYIIITQRNGNVLCYGDGAPVSVVDRTEFPADGARPAVADPSSPPTASRFAETNDAPAQQPPSGDVQRALPAAAQPAPALVASAYSPVVSVSSSDELSLDQRAAQDTSDMVTLSNGGRVHSLPPDVRVELLRDAGNPVDMSWKSEKPCLKVASVSASSTSGKANSSTNTLDRDLRTRWSPAKGRNQWLTYDLGSVQPVGGTSVVWYSPKQANAALTLETSIDGRTFAWADSDVLDGRGTKTTLRTFMPVQARYVRVSIEPSAGSACPSLYEVGIHGATPGAEAHAETR